MIELQGRCKKMSEHGSDEWYLCLHCPDPSLPGLPGLSTWGKTKEQSRVLHTYLCQNCHTVEITALPKIEFYLGGASPKSDKFL